jgi:hypothetical protein
MAFDPATGDFYFADNGIDGNGFGNEAWSTDELNRIPAAQIGGAVEYFGFPYSYTRTIDKPGDPVTVVNPGLGVQPLVAFEPLPDPVLTAEGSESEGPSGFALSPPMFPAGLNHGAFIGFHGLFNAGTANDENPFVFADPGTGHYFDFISNNEPNIGHLDEALSTSDSLFIADISSNGDLFSGAGLGQGVIYQIKAINHPPVITPIGDRVVDLGKTLTVHVSATDPDPGQTLTFRLAAGAPAGATIDAQTGVVTWTPSPSQAVGTYPITVRATDNGTPPLGASGTFLVTIHDGSPPPVITSARLNTRRTFQITLTFSEALDRSSATNPNNYRLVSPGRDRKFGTRDDMAIRLTPSYDAATHTVTLTTRAEVRLNPALRLTVLGSSPGNVSSPTGQLLDGNDDGQPGGNYVATVSKGGITRITPTAIVGGNQGRGPR